MKVLENENERQCQSHSEFLTRSQGRRSSLFSLIHRTPRMLHSLGDSRLAVEEEFEMWNDKSHNRPENSSFNFTLILHSLSQFMTTLSYFKRDYKRKKSAAKSINS